MTLDSEIRRAYSPIQRLLAPSTPTLTPQRIETIDLYYAPLSPIDMSDQNTLVPVGNQTLETQSTESLRLPSPTPIPALPSVSAPSTRPASPSSMPLLERRTGPWPVVPMAIQDTEQEQESEETDDKARECVQEKGKGKEDRRKKWQRSLKRGGKWARGKLVCFDGRE